MLYYAILQVTTPDLIDLPEALLTLLFFPTLVGVAFFADKASDAAWREVHPLVAILHYAILCYTMLYCATLCYTVLREAHPLVAILYYTILYYTVL